MAANDPVDLHFETCGECGAVTLDTGATPPASEIHAAWHHRLTSSLTMAGLARQL